MYSSSPFPSLREPIWSEPARSSPHSSGLFIRGSYLAHCSLRCEPRQHTVDCGCRAHKTHAQASCFGDTFPYPQLNPNSSILSVWLASPFWVFPDFSPLVILMGAQGRHSVSYIRRTRVCSFLQDEICMYLLLMVCLF